MNFNIFETFFESINDIHQFISFLYDTRIYLNKHNVLIINPNNLCYVYCCYFIQKSLQNTCATIKLINEYDFTTSSNADIYVFYNRNVDTCISTINTDKYHNIIIFGINEFDDYFNNCNVDYKLHKCKHIKFKQFAYQYTIDYKKQNNLYKYIQLLLALKPYEHVLIKAQIKFKKRRYLNNF